MVNGNGVNGATHDVRNQRYFSGSAPATNGHSGQVPPESEPILVSVQPIRLSP